MFVLAFIHVGSVCHPCAGGNDSCCKTVAAISVTSVPSAAFLSCWVGGLFTSADRHGHG